MEDRKKVEAVLFSAGKFLTEDEIENLSKLNKLVVQKSLEELKRDYESRDSALSVIKETSSWKMSVRDEYLLFVQGIVTQTELDKPLMETLAVIAWRYPALQADIIKIRHNKAYEHLTTLEEMGFISRQKDGRSRKIVLTQKFFDYFDLPDKKQAQEAFRDVLPEDVKKAIEETERQIMETEKVIRESRESKENEDKGISGKTEERNQNNKLETYQDSKEVDLVDDEGKPVELENYNDGNEENNTEVYDSGREYTDIATNDEVKDEQKNEPEKESNEDNEEPKNGEDKNNYPKDDIETNDIEDNSNK